MGSIPLVPKPIKYFLILSPLLANAFVSVSRSSSAVAIGSAMDPLTFMTTGVDYTGDSNCYVEVGSVSLDSNRERFETPQICLQIEMVASEVASANASANIPDGIVTGMIGQQPLVMSLDYKGGLSGKPNLRDPFYLPNGYFPVATATDRGTGEIYVALHETQGTSIVTTTDDTASKMTSTLDYVETLTRPTLLPGSGNHSPLIFKYDVGEGQLKWETTLITEEGKSTISALSTVASRGKLVAVGSSTGYGSYVGAGSRSKGWDGYITILDMEDGKIDPEGAVNSFNAPHSTRIYTQPDQDDFVHGVCTGDGKAYVLGSTTGKMKGDEAGGGFVIKYDIDDLSLIWKYQFVGVGVEATHCVIKGETLYVAGTVPPGVVLDDPNNNNSKGGKPSDTSDVFVALFYPDLGEMSWIRQIDSHRDDDLIGIGFDGVSNLLITVNGKNTNDGNNALYVMSIDNDDGKHDWQFLPQGKDPLETIAIRPNDFWTIIVAIIIPLLILVILTVYYFRDKNKQRPKIEETEVDVQGELV